MMLIVSYTGVAQDFKTFVTNAENEQEANSHFSTDFDDYEMVITLYKNESFLTDYIGLFIKPRFTLNSKLVDDNYSWAVVNTYTSENADEDDYFIQTPAVKFEIRLNDLIKHLAHSVKEKNNELKIEFIYEDVVLASTNITFDVPGFSDFSSSFCDMNYYSVKNEDKSINDMLIKELAKTFPNASDIMVMANKYGWSEYESDDKVVNSGTFLVLFKDGENHWYLRYNVSYFTTAGVKDENMTVKFYNGIKNPSAVSEPCLKSILQSLE